MAEAARRIRTGLRGDVPAIRAILAGNGDDGPVLPVLLEAGFHVVDQDQYLASDPDIVDPARLLPNPGML